MGAFLDNKFMVNDSYIALLWNGWCDVKFGTMVKKISLTFGFIPRESDCHFIAPFSTWGFWVLYALYYGNEGLVRRSATCVGFKILVSGRHCVIIRMEVAQVA